MTGGQPRQALVEIQGVPALDIVDTAADITIMGLSLFKKVAVLARLKKDFKPADKCHHTYTHELFKLHGCMDLNITFGERTMRTPVFIKMDARDPLFLSEGACRQLGIISYNQDVLPEKKTKPKDQMDGEEAKAPAVRVCLLQSVSVPLGHSSLVQVNVKVTSHPGKMLLLEYDPNVEASTSVPGR